MSRAVPVKYILVLIVIIGLVTYIFTGGRKPAAGEAEAAVDRRQEIWDRIAQLEYQRRDMLVRAKGRVGSPASAARRPRCAGSYAMGYFEGFDQGYYEGSFVARGRRPDPLFFPVPNP